MARLPEDNLGKTYAAGHGRAGWGVIGKREPRGELRDLIVAPSAGRSYGHSREEAQEEACWTIQVSARAAWLSQLSRRLSQPSLIPPWLTPPRAVRPWPVSRSGSTTAPWARPKQPLRASDPSEPLEELRARYAADGCLLLRGRADISRGRRRPRARDRGRLCGQGPGRGHVRRDA